MNYLEKFCLQLQKDINHYEMLMDLEQHIPKLVWHEPKTSTKNATMAFYSEKLQFNLEIDASGAGQGASLLQVRDRMWFPRNEGPDV